MVDPTVESPRSLQQQRSAKQCGPTVDASAARSVPCIRQVGGKSLIILSG